MFIPRIYYPHPLDIGAPLQLQTETSHYIAKVLRLKEKDPIKIFNGQGGEYSGHVLFQDKKPLIRLEAYFDTNNESSIYVELGQGISRSERMDFSIQKSTEMGVNKVVPLITKRSLVKLDEQKKSKRQQHWQRVAISACEQSGRTMVPECPLPMTLEAWCKEPFDGISIIFDTMSRTSIKTLTAHTKFRIAIGPESGFEPAEITLLSEHGFEAVSLGPRILRTETAGIVAMTLLQNTFGDL